MSTSHRPLAYRRHPWGQGVLVYVLPEQYIVLRRSRTGHVYGSALLPFLTEGVENQRLEVARSIWGGAGMKRKDPSSVPGLSLHASPDLLKGNWPSLAEWLTSALYEDGGRRESPTLTVWASAGQWKLSLKDRAEGLVMWLSAEKLLEVLQLAELLVLSADAPWRHDEWGDEKKGKRAKK